MPASTEKRLASKDVGRDRRIPVIHTAPQNSTKVEKQRTGQQKLQNLSDLCSSKNSESVYFVLNLLPVKKLQKSLFDSGSETDNRQTDRQADDRRTDKMNLQQKLATLKKNNYTRLYYRA